jgi:hypothetical protein
MLGFFYIHFCAFGSVLNILLLMFANLVGFALGIAGITEMLNNLFRRQG